MKEKVAEAGPVARPSIRLAPCPSESITYNDKITIPKLYHETSRTRSTFQSAQIKHEVLKKSCKPDTVLADLWCKIHRRR